MQNSYFGESEFKLGEEVTVVANNGSQISFIGRVGIVAEVVGLYQIGVDFGERIGGDTWCLANGICQNNTGRYFHALELRHTHSYKVDLI